MNWEEYKRIYYDNLGDWDTINDAMSKMTEKPTFKKYTTSELNSKIPGYSLTLYEALVKYPDWKIGKVKCSKCNKEEMFVDLRHHTGILCERCYTAYENEMKVRAMINGTYWGDELVADSEGNDD